LAAIPVTKRADPSLNLNLDELPVDRGLGVQWHIETDAFGDQSCKSAKADTMRGVLSTMCSVFDPLNLAAPVMLLQSKSYKICGDRKGRGTNHLTGKTWRDDSSGRTTFPSYTM